MDKAASRIRLPFYFLLRLFTAAVFWSSDVFELNSQPKRTE